jgi:hypothetical protein
MDIMWLSSKTPFPATCQIYPLYLPQVPQAKRRAVLREIRIFHRMKTVEYVKMAETRIPQGQWKMWNIEGVFREVVEHTRKVRRNG